MIGYITIGTKDPHRAAAFYDPIAAELGAVRFMENNRIIGWGKPGGTAGLCLARPFDGEPMSAGNGAMAGLLAKDRAQVDRIYQLALLLGGTSEGPPGPRGTNGFYAAYFRDPEGNKLNAYVVGGA